MTCPRRAAAALVALLLTGPAATGCGVWSTGTAKPARCAAPTAPPEGVVGTADAAPGGGGLRVTAQGFTQQTPARGLYVSLGAEVENTSDRVAYHARVTFDYTDAAHRSAVVPGHREVALEIPIILPGQRIPVGTWSYVRSGGNGWPVTVSDMRVVLGPVRWVPRDATFATLSVRSARNRHDSVDPLSGSVGYEVDSGYCRTLTPRGVGMVFRDSAGAIVGGSLDPYHAADGYDCRPGRSAATAAVDFSLPPTADDTRTDIYPYCDLAPPGTPGPDGPIN